jgi:hypothetical protein
VADGDAEPIIFPIDDTWYPSRARKDGIVKTTMQYLTWEVGLLETMTYETYITFFVT